MRAATALGLLAAALALSPARAEVFSGIDVLEESGFQALKGKNIGLITNHTGIDRKGRLGASVLANAPGIKLKALFSPEHGFTGTLDQENIDSESYLLPGGEKIPLFSLYGATKTPTAEMLKGIDALVFDIQDIGTRFYTYATTMALALETAKAQNIEFFVLDRPNPVNGKTVEGTVLHEGVKHFIAYLPVPVRHGMTMGELARIYNFHARLGAKLQVIALKGWRRGMWFDETGLPWVRPSPNMPDLAAAALYPGTGCFEASNLSVGRGTPHPFGWIGAPWLDAGPVLRKLEAAKLKGVRFKAETYTPSKSVHAGEKSPGIRIVVTDREAVRPLEVFAHLAAALRDTHAGKFELKSERMTLMTGTPEFVKLYASGAPAQELAALFDAEAARFSAERAPFLLY